MPINVNGPIFSGFKRVLRDVQRKPLSADTETCSQEIVEELLRQRTTNERPGMLLGRIQSGKTRAFVGAIAIAFDNGFDIAIVLTKGTVALTTQTVTRLRSDLGDSVQPREVIIEDIRHLPELAQWEQGRKLVFVCKKETRNLQRLGDVMLRTYPDFVRRRVLVIDDEADTASVGYRRQDGLLDLRVIPGHIDDLRTGLADNAYYLQVTATPQALFLQPVNIDLPGRPRVRQVRPIFTKTVPIHAGYIGGRNYFEISRRANTTESFLHVPFPQSELDALVQEDRTIFEIENVLTAPAVSALRRALITFVVGGIIRQLQQEDTAQAAEMYSFIVHTATRTNTHQWQNRVARELIRQLQESAATNPQAIQPLIDAAYLDLQASLTAEGLETPTLERVTQQIGTAFGSMMVATVNGTRDIQALLDPITGQLRLRTPYNVFIGGQILDRGLTIENLIGFYYGRAPKRGQEDTTLQHCRMYGSRPRSDLAVTRFYTTPPIYQRMLGIYEREEALWQIIASGEMDPDRVFLQADPTGQMRPCGLQKIAASQITTLTAGRELLPVGFSTIAARRVRDAVRELEGIIAGRLARTFDVTVDLAVEMIDLTSRMVHMDTGEIFDWKAMKAAIRLLAQQNPAVGERDRVVCLVRAGVNFNKFRLDRGIERLQNEPQGYRDPDAIRRVAHSAPGLILLGQVGSVQDRWSGEAFYWPILVIPDNVPPRLFSEEND